MALAGGHPNVPFIYAGLPHYCWLASLEMLMSYRHGCKFGRSYAKAIGGPVQWGEPRSAHTAYVLKKKGFLGMRIERGALTTGSRYVDHAVDYGLRAVDHLKKESSLAGWQAALSEAPILAEGRFGLAPVGEGRRGVLLVGWSASGMIAYYDPAKPWRKHSYLTIERLLERTASPRSCFWRSL